ncbi:unnamed protein product [Clonostachys solani]|uniref:Uncharacterized protein n=1 Tax=Clonostachys solani TaxID=160281 RepID=A0A9P0EKJ5_9HYPO|nr:unnamed protein product [Clonostachys solani]
MEKHFLGPEASQDTAIVIPEDSDAEDEGYGGEDSHSPQSYTTTATSIATHFSAFLRFGTFPGASPDSQHIDSMGTKHSSTEAGAAITMGNTPTESQVGVEGDSIPVYGSHLDPSADPEPNAQTTNSTSAGDVDFGSPPTNTKSQPCQTMSDEQPFTEAIPASSEPVAITADDGSDEESGNLQNSPVTPSRCTYSPMVPTSEVRAQTPLSDGEVCLSAEQDDITIVHNPSLSPALSTELPLDQGQDYGRRSRSSSDTESGSSEAEPGSLLGT